MTVKDKKEIGGLTPLMHAATLKSADELCRALRRLTEDLDVQDDSGWTALHYAANAGLDEHISLLLEAGANPHLPNKEDLTAADLAAKKGYVEIAALLETAKKDIPAIRPEDLPARVAELEKTVKALQRKLEKLEEKS